ncbi:hypothetical protein MA16_Dca000813 [Dendrobium catenatum]|uniref:Uncharacterized protein n=1 Tax=Dendrobium catenatum TaxID=906689 RepID=A0A2I0WUY2_9ASPA|nr:hypothetical protein MA16_Dca000813 [Dendrobium catenatum]
MGYGPWLIIKRRINTTGNSRNNLPKPRVSSTWKKVEGKKTLPVLRKVSDIPNSAQEIMEEIPFVVEVKNTFLSKEHEQRNNYGIHSSNNKFSVLSNLIEEGEIIQDFHEEVDICGKTALPIDSAQPDPIQIVHNGMESTRKTMAKKKKKSKQLKDLGHISSHSRIRRLDVESKGNEGASSPPSHQ